MAEVTVNKISSDIVENYSEQDLKLIPSFDVVSQFNPETDNVEFSIYNEQNILDYIDYNYTDYTITLDYVTEANTVSSVNVNPEEDLIKNGYSQGVYTVYYNFLRNQLSSSIDNPFYIKEISSDRTELRIANNNVTNNELKILVENFKNQLNNSAYFEDFEVNFGNNNIFLANNIVLDSSNASQYTVLVKLYEPLDTQFTAKSTLNVVLQTAGEVSYRVAFPQEVIPPPLPKTLKGPNFNLGIKNKVNNSTAFTDKSTLLEAPPSGLWSGSLGELQGILKNKGITPNIDYSDFNNFVYFSSAEQRVRNFYYKVGLIQEYSASLVEINNLSSAESSGSIVEYQNKINNILENFDEYEKYQYYSSGSSSNIYPKTSSTKPYSLALTGSIEATNWLTDQATNSGSEYDLENSDRLVNSLPSYIQDDTRNTQFFLFMDMIGQHFDNIWVYTNDVANRFDADNRLKYGISKNVVADAIRSMGVNLYQSNFNSENLLSSFTGYNPGGGSLPPTGNEVIETYVTSSNNPTVIDDVNKEFYKRIFHNLPLLLKQKGSIAGLRTLINTFGVPDSVLRISEYGGKDRVNSNDYDYYQSRFNYGLTGTDVSLSTTSLNGAFVGGLNNISFRFKYISGALPANGDSLLFATIGGNSLNLEYTGGGFISASYSGSIPSASVYNGVIGLGGAQVTASFFNGEWWTIGVEPSKLRIGTKIYNGDDGFKTGFTASEAASITLGTSMALNGSDNKFAFQELRLYNKAATNSQFDDLVMNPQSLEGNSFNQSKNQLAFRAPLGAELDIENNQTSTPYSSVHPAITGSAITQSFSSNSNYQFIGGTVTYITSSEFVYMDQPAVGIKNRVSQKIRNESLSLPSGNTLSSQRSIQQKYSITNSGSYTKDINLLEIALSPQNEINDDINSSFGYFNIGEYIGDPRQISESINSYPNLDSLRNLYFEKYFKSYDLKDYIRLIKFFDNSLFKMIKDFAPAKSNLATGITIKQHLLERNKQKPPVASSSLHDYSGSIQSGFALGGTGGVFDSINNLGTNPEAQASGSKNYLSPQLTQSWHYTVQTISGSLIVTQSTQDEFYNGELGGSEFIVTDGELNFPYASESLSSPFNATYNTVYPNWANTSGLQVAGKGFILADVGIGKVYQIGLSVEDQNSTSYATYMKSLTEGDSITLKIINTGTTGIQPDLLARSFTINSITYKPSIAGDGYIFGVDHDFPLTGTWLEIAQWDPAIDGYNWFTNVELIYDGTPIGKKAALRNPLYNNVDYSRRSVIYQDVDYSNNAVTPVNFNLITSGSALKAAVQDSNYKQKSWVNSRYKGTRVSSLGFNIPIQR